MMQKELPKNGDMDDEELQDLVRNLRLKFRSLTPLSWQMQRISMRRSMRSINPNLWRRRRRFVCAFSESLRLDGIVRAKARTK